MNDSKNSSKGLLVLRYPEGLTLDQVTAMGKQIEPLAARMGLEPVTLPLGFDIEAKAGNEALLERVCVALEALVAQGTPPEINVAEIAPQALNARPSGLNSRPLPYEFSAPRPLRDR